MNRRLAPGVVAVAIARICLRTRNDQRRRRRLRSEADRAEHLPTLHERYQRPDRLSWRALAWTQPNHLVHDRSLIGVVGSSLGGGGRSVHSHPSGVAASAAVED
jgi:hypothetical protein